MLTRLNITTPPLQLPVSVDLARQHLRVLQDDSDELIQLYLRTATEVAEAYLNKTLLTTSYSWVLADSYPPLGDMLSSSSLVVVPLAIAFQGAGTWRRALELPRGPIQSISSVSFGTWSGSDTVLVQGTDYDSDLTLNPPRLRMYNQNLFNVSDHMTITYQAGMGSDPAVLPASIKHAILLILTAAYEKRGDDDFAIPQAAYRLLDQFRLYHFPD